jgi:hypothetical protein
MRTSSAILILVGGFACGVGFVMSCGDQTSPANVDAAQRQCDCPAAEPPLTGRIVRMTSNDVVPAMTSSGVSVFCEFGTILLSGGCYAKSTDPKYVLKSSFPGPDGVANPGAWNCEFYNGTAALVTSTAYAMCLKPAP